MCPDTTFRPSDGRTCTNDITAVSGGVIDREQCVLFTRSFNTCESVCNGSCDGSCDQYEPCRQVYYIMKGKKFMLNKKAM